MTNTAPRAATMQRRIGESGARLPLQYDLSLRSAGANGCLHLFADEFIHDLCNGRSDNARTLVKTPACGNARPDARTKCGAAFQLQKSADLLNTTQS